MEMTHPTIRLSQDLQQIAKDLDKAIEESAGERIGFTLIIYTEGRASYVSNVAREASVREMLRLIAYWEAGNPDTPAHSIQ